jgi:hypothetical protein
MNMKEEMYREIEEIEGERRTEEEEVSLREKIRRIDELREERDKMMEKIEEEERTVLKLSGVMKVIPLVDGEAVVEEEEEFNKEYWDGERELDDVIEEARGSGGKGERERDEKDNREREREERRKVERERINTTVSQQSVPSTSLVPIHPSQRSEPVHSFPKPWIATE